MWLSKNNFQKPEWLNQFEVNLEQYFQNWDNFFANIQHVIDLQELVRIVISDAQSVEYHIDRNLENYKELHTGKKKKYI